MIYVICRPYYRFLQLRCCPKLFIQNATINTYSFNTTKHASSNFRTKNQLATGGLLRQLCSTSDVSCKSKEDIVNYLKSGRAKKVVVMTGAGISTASGIPDFRTPGSGLYDNLQQYNVPYPEAIFEIRYFNSNPKPFFAWAKDVFASGQYRPNPAHYFIKLLENKGLLLRSYTQNIDNLERLAGVSDDKLVEAHGTFKTATCRFCYKSRPGDEIKESVLNGEVPRCREPSCNGVIKPDIVFFGENLPAKFFTFKTDMPQADLLIIMGTSLEVYPFAGLAEVVLPTVPRLLFNREACGSFVTDPKPNDVVVEGDLVEEVLRFCDLLGWRQDLDNLVNSAKAAS